MGLLDFAATPEGQGLLSMAFGGLANARRGAPINTIGRAGLAGLQGYTNAIDQQSQQQTQADMRKYREMQMAQIQQQQEAQQRQQAAIQSILPNLSESDRTAFTLGVPVSDIWKKNNPADLKPQLVTVNTPTGPVQRWVKPGETTGVDVGAPADKESALPWYAKKGPDGRISIDPAFADLEKTKASFGRAPAAPMAPVAYLDDKGNAVWGTITEAKGRPAANFNPTMQGAIAGAKEGAKVSAKTQTEAAFDAPRVIQNSETAIKNADDILKHPGFEQAVGASSLLGVQKIPGTDAKDFMNRLDQIKGGAFLEAFNSLKGGGQITEVEGKKATDAIARMDNATSEKEFTQAVRDYQSVVRAGMNRAKMRAGGNQQQTAPQQSGGAKFLGFE